MTTQDYLKQVAYIGFTINDGEKYDAYYSKFDDSYITRVGMEDSVELLAEREITEELTHGVGFSPKDNKWYGWSHRAIFGFTVGSTCTEGDCHYRPKNPDDFLKGLLRFWSDEYRENVSAKHYWRELTEDVPVNPGEAEQKSVHTGKYEYGVLVEWVYGSNLPKYRLRRTINSLFCVYPEVYGRGEWVAETLEDAKQMAIDFNLGVS